MQADWTEIGGGVALVGIATRAAEAGLQHSIHSVSASYSAAQIGLLQVKVDGVVKLEVYVHNSIHVPLPAAIRGLTGKAVSAEISAGAAGVTGKVGIVGFTK